MIGKLTESAHKQSGFVKQILVCEFYHIEINLMSITKKDMNVPEMFHYIYCQYFIIYLICLNSCIVIGAALLKRVSFY